ncbi:hypothetical protein V6N12_069823 [Hibiscus sabdariffa]|uniref:Zinc knuckle CX2CX4HX4C domain-containing protein n=1 Tax=Hibiscus sabdariffa TaxID=183260 RepID=A0ABR2FF13_9ROSI
MAWNRLSGLPLTLYNCNFIEGIGSQVGSVIKIDFQTDNGCRGRFVRMSVSLNLCRPLVSKVIIDGRPHIVKYESLSTVCFHCGIYDQLKDICPKLQCQDVEPLFLMRSLGLLWFRPRRNIWSLGVGEKRKTNPHIDNHVNHAPKGSHSTISTMNHAYG